MKKKVLLSTVAAGLLAVSIAVAGRMVATSTDEKKGATVATENTRTPVIVELFTSEGCSSCPPADALLAQLEKTQPVKGAEVIVLALHVDYWNRLGWADPFSSPAFSERQGEYSRAFGKQDVYTPQMVVDGQAEFNGSNQNRAYQAITKAAQTPKASVRLTTPARGEAEKSLGQVRLRVNVDGLPAVSDGDAAEVLLAVTESNLSTNVARGENAGRRLSHAGVVRSLTVIGSVDPQGGGAFTADTVVEIGKGMRRENLRVVVFVQERASRRVLGAAATRLTE
jgi:hypothetical protein